MVIKSHCGRSFCSTSVFRTESFWREIITKTSSSHSVFLLWIHGCLWPCRQTLTKHFRDSTIYRGCSRQLLTNPVGNSFRDTWHFFTRISLHKNLVHLPCLIIQNGTEVSRCEDAKELFVYSNQKSPPKKAGDFCAEVAQLYFSEIAVKLRNDAMFFLKNLISFLLKCAKNRRPCVIFTLWIIYVQKCSTFGPRTASHLPKRICERPFVRKFSHIGLVITLAVVTA